MILGLPYNTALVLAGAMLLGAASGVVGCFAVLRRRSLTGDALAHAALPGVCLAYLITGQRDFHALLAGAFVSGLAGIGTIAMLRRWTRLKEDAAIAVVLSVFYALGLVFLVRIARGGGDKAGLQSFILGQLAAISRSDVESILLLAVASLTIVLVFYKEFKLVAFDQEFARVQGWPALALDFFLQLLIVLTVVIGLPAVGVLLMAGFLIIPAAAARFWTERLGLMLVCSAVFGMTAGLTGALVSSTQRLPPGPLIILAAAFWFLVSLFFGVRRGLWRRWVEQRSYRRDLDLKRLLLALVPGEALSKAAIAASLGWSRWRTWRVLTAAAQSGWVQHSAGRWELTETGQAEAKRVQIDKERWRQLLLEYPQQAPGWLRLDLPSPEPAAAELARR